MRHKAKVFSVALLAALVLAPSAGGFAIAAPDPLPTTAPDRPAGGANEGSVGTPPGSAYESSVVERQLVASRTAALLSLIDPQAAAVSRGLDLLKVESIEQILDPDRPLPPQMRALRARIAEEETLAREAEDRAEQARSRARFASERAARANENASLAQRRLEQFAVLMYRSSGMTPMMTALLNSDTRDLAEALNSAEILEHVSGSYNALKEEAEQALALAEEVTSQARAAVLEATAAEGRAQVQLQGLQGLLQAIEAELGNIEGVGGPQKLITAKDCPTRAPAGTLRGAAAELGIQRVCADSVAQAATPQAALAIKWALHRLGAPYACEGVGRLGAFQFDCSSLVSRAYFNGAGIPVAGDNWAPTTRNMVPWDGIDLDRHYAMVAPRFAAPGDLILYDTGGASYRHVVMLLAGGLMVHTNSCGDVAHVTDFVGYPSAGSQVFLVARRVMADPNYVPLPIDPAVTGRERAGAAGPGAVQNEPQPEAPGDLTDGVPAPTTTPTPAPSPDPSSSPDPSPTANPDPESGPEPSPGTDDPSGPPSPEPTPDVTPAPTGEPGASSRVHRDWRVHGS